MTVDAPVEPRRRDDPAVPAWQADPPGGLPPDDPTPIAQRAVGHRRAWRRVRWAGVVLFGVAVGYYCVSLWQVWATGQPDADPQEPVEAIVVLGAAQYDGRPSPQLAARLDHVVALWEEGVAPVVVVTGGNRPGDRFTEAESSANYLIGAGVPAEAIVGEDEGASTYESLDAVADLLDERGIGSVVIVTDPYHALRSKLIARELGIDADVSPTDTSVVTGSAALRRNLTEAAAVSVGRIIGFDRVESLTN